MQSTRGDFIDGRFLEPAGAPLVSRNPARDGAPVLETLCSSERVGVAVAAAKEAQYAWSRKSLDERLAILHRFRAAIAARKEPLADAIVQEIGKIRPEARAEIDSLIGRFDLVAAQIRAEMRDGPLPGFPNESLRWHPHGVVAVIGPFNFPLHLCHAHVVPALLLGNTVVVKPSEVAPLSGIRYAEAAIEAGLPPGILNVVQGKGPTGAALVAHPDVHGLAFTGSWPVGRRITEAALDRPEMLIALEMGGKNTVIVCEDADVRQAAHEIVVGGYLTSGQRCTCTDRVLVHRGLAAPLLEALRRLVSALRFGDPDDPSAFAGPMATEEGRAKLERAMAAAEAAGADVLVESRRLPGGYYRTGSIHVLPAGVHEVAGYTDTELFGPDLGIEIVESDDEAIAVINASPYGFANSVFTPSDARFDRYYRETRCGILNRNRSTNQASPRLPFGGTGRSGNFRPAGSFAPRNLAIPVAVQANSVLSTATHAHLAHLLPPHDLDRLEAMHDAEAADEAARDRARPNRILRPRGGALPESTRWLERLHAGDRVPREKKPAVFDHARSHGAYYVSIDRDPLCVLDAMSQTATSPLGFQAPELVRAYLEGAFGDAVLRAHDVGLEGPGRSAAARYAETLRARVPGLPTVCFAASGAEANEKALALCRIERPAATRVLAFEGSFHGRTLLSLYASHSPGKRVPFEIAGYEVDFAPWPRWPSPGAEPAEPAGWAEACARADAGALGAIRSDDPVLCAEIDSLAQVIEVLRAGATFAVIVEPMQSEGGDRYASARWHRGLRLVTRALGVPLILDEVQCGFGLGGTFAWHERFGYVAADGSADRPDCVTFAKRAQVGVVMTRFLDPEPTQAFAASLIRGRLHAEAIDPRASVALETEARARFFELERRFGHRISGLRASGCALAFDLATPAELEAYLGQRFWRGAIVFGAGDRTVRYRLSAAWGKTEIDRLFAAIHASLAWLDAHEGEKPPAWHDLAEPPPRTAELELRVRRARPDEVEALMPQILALEARVYEEARRDPESRLRIAFHDPDGIPIVAEKRVGDRWELVGYAFGAPLELFPEIGGPDRDPARGRGDTMYSIAMTVDPALQGRQLGRRLKQLQIDEARAQRRADGSTRYLWLSGRNREGWAEAMARLVESLGAFHSIRVPGQYDGSSVARYYRLPLAPLAVEGGVRRDPALGVDLASGLVAPLEDPPRSLLEAERCGLVAGAAIDKLTLVNYVTPAVVRAIEYAAALVPDLPHVFLTSGRDEIVDKAIRILRWHRKKGAIVIGLEGGYVGHTTAAARSISDPSTHRMGPAHFDWPLVPHPELAGEDACMRAIREVIDRAGREAILGIVLEAIQERTGRVIAPSFAARLAALREETGVPFVSIETAGAYYRAGTGAFAGDAWDVLPDMRAWWTGGQLGMLHVSKALYVSDPLTFVSTWDGDELSLLQMQHQLRAARRIDIATHARALEAALAGRNPRGLGLYRVIDSEDGLLEALRASGITVRQHPNGTLGVAPALDRAADRIAALAKALARGG